MSFLQYDIGRKTTIPDWPTNDLDGLFDALSRWQLDPRLDMSTSKHFDGHPLRAPFRGPALRFAGKRWNVERDCYLYLSGDLVHPEAPNAVSYCGNFLRYSFGWTLTTDDPELIAKLDAAIAENLARYAS